MYISTMKKVGIALLLVGSLLFVSLPVYADEATGGLVDEAYQGQAEVMAEIEANKAAFAQELAAKWEAEALARGNDETWLERTSGVLSEKDAGSLLSMSEAESYDEFIGIQTTSELVFYPLKPCRVVDTRFATKWGPFGTPIGSGGTIPFRTWTPSLAGQGGAAECLVNSDSAAVVVNVTAVPVSGGQGFLTVWPYLQSRPNASLVNYNSGSTSGAIANAVSQSQCRLCAEELNVYASRTTHVIIDVIGYFARPTATIPDQFIVSTGLRTMPTGTYSLFTSTCPSGYRLSGVAGLVNLWTLDIELTGVRAARNDSVALVSGANSGTQALCQFYNKSGASRTSAIECHAICLRQPGR
jgi:hypothetical protein